MESSNEEKKKRFVRMDQVYSSYHDYVCYLGIEQETGLQVFWYEFINDSMPSSEIEKGFNQLQKAKMVTSPYLLNILSVWQTSVPSRFYLITETTQAPSLYDYIHSIESSPLPRTLIKWFKLLSLAVQSLHKNGIPHGTITLHNIFIKTSTGSLKLRLPLTHLSCRAISSASLNITQYTSPERLDGTFEPCIDIWSLGICFLELLTQQPAYSECKTPQELILAIRSLTPPQSLALVQNKAAQSLIQSCLTPPNKRPRIDQILEDSIFGELSQTSIQQTHEVDGSIQIILQNDHEDQTPNS